VFRLATVSDLDALLALYRQLHPEDPELAADDARHRFESIAAQDGLSIFVWDDAGAIVATTYLNVIPNLTRGGAPYANIENVVVDETRRGQGFGKKTLTATLDAAWEAGCYKAELTTGSTEESTHAFYRSCGLRGDSKTAYIAHRPVEPRA
jgi:GNAT superfamily N-acetyltransferase